MKALLMVGGEGRRLRPLTSDTPKSLLRVGRHTILDHTLLLLRRFGIQDVTLAVNYLAHKIEDHVGSGERAGMRASYLRETVPLGTAGALSLLDSFDATMLMMNGDIVTDIDIAAMRSLHTGHGAAMTVASKVMYTDLSLGVLDVGEDGLIQAYREKPRIAHRFGIGIYLLEPSVRRHMQTGERLDVPELIARLLQAGEKVACYDHPGHWIDIGLPEDYARVQSMAEDLAALVAAGA
jgi:NDP-mannose synthase